MASEFHPDKNRSPDATHRMQVVNAAHRVLSDPVLRSNYDRQIGITERDQECQERERQQREERERQQREERERQQREERERQQREERERQQREERERQQRPRRRPWLIPAGFIGVIGVILVAVVGTLIGTQVFGSQAPAAPPPTRAPTPPPVATLALTATTAPTVTPTPTATPAPTVTRTPAPTATPVPTPTSAPQLALPAPPALLSATAIGHESVALTWANPRDPGIIGYQILRRNPDTDAAGVFALLANDTGSADTVYVDHTAQPETSYVYRVRARNAAGLSGHSDDIAALTPTAPVPTPRPTVAPTPIVVPTPTVNLAGWTTLPTLNKSGYQSRKQDVNLVACVAGDFEKHRRGQTVPFSDDGSYGRSVPLIVVDVIVAGAVGPQLCYKMTLKYVTDTVMGFCDDDPYAGCDREGPNYWERGLPLFRLLSIRDSWALPP